MHAQGRAGRGGQDERIKTEGERGGKKGGLREIQRGGEEKGGGERESSRDFKTLTERKKTRIKQE